MDKITTTIQREWLKQMADNPEGRIPRYKALLGETLVRREGVLSSEADQWNAS